MPEKTKDKEPGYQEELDNISQMYDLMDVVMKTQGILTKNALHIAKSLQSENTLLKRENAKLKKQLTDILMKEGK